MLSPLQLAQNNRMIRPQVRPAVNSLQGRRKIEGIPQKIRPGLPSPTYDPNDPILQAHNEWVKVRNEAMREAYYKEFGSKAGWSTGESSTGSTGFWMGEGRPQAIQGYNEWRNRFFAEHAATHSPMPQLPPGGATPRPVRPGPVRPIGGPHLPFTPKKTMPGQQPERQQPGNREEIISKFQEIAKSTGQCPVCGK